MRLVLGLIGMLIVACGHGHGQVRRDIAQRPWTEVTTSHFQLTTDLPRATAIARARELERMWHALAREYELLSGIHTRPRGRITIVHLRHCRDFSAVAARDNVGSFIDYSMDFLARRMLVTCDSRVVGPHGKTDGGPSHSVVFLHELAHTFNHHHFSMLPPWLNEGLATYFETLEIGTAQVTIGRAPRAYRARRTFINSSTPATTRWAPLDTLLALDDQGFYHGGRSHHLAAWGVTHMLSSEIYRTRFSRYLQDMASGTRRRNAWRRAFSGLGKQLRSDYKLYVDGRARRRTFRKTSVAPATSSHKERRIRRAEVHAMWAHLQMLRARKLGPKADVSPVRVHLELAAAADPLWPGLDLWRAAAAAHFAGASGTARSAEVLLRRYVKAAPQDTRGWMGLLTVGMRARLPPRHLGLEPVVPPRLAELEPIALQLQRRATHASEFHRVAEYYAMRHQPVPGLAFVDRALELDPGCVACIETRALLLFHGGQLTAAVAQFQRATLIRTGHRISPRTHLRLRWLLDAQRRRRP